MPFISVIIPIYNLAEYLVETLTSCLNQSFTDIEIICINDGSTDDSIKILRYYAKQDSRIIIIDKSNEGVVAARYDGVKRSTGEFLFFLDGDDTLPFNALELLVSKQKESNVDVVRGNFSILSEDGVWQDNISLPQIKSSEDWFTYLCLTGSGAMWNHLIRKRSFMDATSIPKELVVGEDLYALIQLSTFRVLIDTIYDTTYNYRLRKNSVMNSHNNDSSQIMCFVQHNFDLCEKLLNLSVCLSYYQRNKIKLLVLDKMCIYILPYDGIDKKKTWYIYKKCFLESLYVQLMVFRRSWKGYLSLLKQLFDFI